jgi:signal transduction histidine kinase
LEIVVEDNGQGFDARKVTVEEVRNGLGNMRRRAEAIDGVLTLQSTPGKGTTVGLTVNFAS